MDSVSQIALGAAVGVATMGRRTATWKAALWGAVAGTLPDLDVLIDHGDPVRNMVLHRAETHALFWLTLFSLPFSAAVARLHGEWRHWRRWWLALWLALYFFTFAVAQRRGAVTALEPVQQLGSRPDVRRVLPWLWRRMWGEPLPAPR